MRAIAALLLLTLTLAACDVDATSTATVAATSTNATVGQTVTLTGDSRVTLYAIERPVASAARQPTDGYEFATIDIELCSPDSMPTGETMTANPVHFDVIMTDNTRASRELSVKAPVFPAEDMIAGECVRGWLTYEVAIGVDIQRVRYGGRSHDNQPLVAAWTVE